MHQRLGSMHAPAWRPAIGIAERADGAARHRPHHRSGLSTEQQQILELQRQAGNAAVTRALNAGKTAGQVTSIDRMVLNREGMAPEKGVQQIRDKTTNKLTLALTQRSIVDAPPLFKAETPKQDKGGYTTQARKVGSIPEPEIHEFWPKEGLHKMADGSLLDVSQKWEEDLQKGEDQHRDDALLAWNITWKAVQTAINKFAAKPGPPAATADDAVRALWKRYVASLDEELRPKGAMPTEAAQLDVLGVRPGTFFAHAWETTVVRDTRDYHTAAPGALPKEGGHPAPKDAIVLGVVGGNKFDVKDPEPKVLSDQLREKWRSEPGRVITGSLLK
jgi:hypothetical protein